MARSIRAVLQSALEPNDSNARLALSIHIDTRDVAVADFASFLAVIDRTYGVLVSSSLLSYSLDRRQRLTVYDVQPGSTHLIIITPETVKNGAFYLSVLVGAVAVMARAYRDVGEGRRAHLEANRIKHELHDVDRNLPAMVSHNEIVKMDRAQRKKDRAALRKVFSDVIPTNTLTPQQLSRLITVTLNALDRSRHHLRRAERCASKVQEASLIETPRNRHP